MSFFFVLSQCNISSPEQLCACDNGHLIHKTCHCQDLVEPHHQYWISAVTPQTSFCKRPVVVLRNIGCYLRLQGLLTRIYYGETLTILQLPAESHLVCLLKEAWRKFESDSHPREKLTRKKWKLLSVVTLSLVHLEASPKIVIKFLLAILLLKIVEEKRMHNMNTLIFFVCTASYHTVTLPHKTCLNITSHYDHTIFVRRFRRRTKGFSSPFAWNCVL